MTITGKLPDIVGHRGYRGANNRAGNLLSAFQKAADLGVGTIEFDVRKTKDGKLVLHHDARAGAKLIRKMRQGELPLVEGERMPTLDEAISFAKSRGLKMFVELKEAGYEAEVLDHLLSQVPTSQFDIISFKRDAIAAVEYLRPDVRTGLLIYEIPVFRSIQQTFMPDRPVRLAKKVGADFVAVNTPIANNELLDIAEKAQMPLAIWTVDKLRDLQRYVRDPRVDHVITDIPDIAKSLLPAI